MMVSLFDQFSTPILLGIPLVAIAIAIPYIFLPKPLSQWLINRCLEIQAWIINRFTHQILTPLKKSGEKWALLTASTLILLMFLNMFGTAPYTYAPTTQLSISFGLALPLWLATVIIGMRNQPTRSLGHNLPEGTPWPLIPVLIIIETISLMIRPLSLAVRLAANITAGHLLIHLISGAIVYLVTWYAPLSLALTLVLCALLLLEGAVAVIQAHVFVLLLVLYLQDNIK